MKFGRIVLHINVHQLSIFHNAHFQDGGHDVHWWLTATYAAAFVAGH